MKLVTLSWGFDYDKKINLAYGLNLCKLVIEVV